MNDLSSAPQSSTAAAACWLIAIPCVTVTLIALVVVLGELTGFEPLSEGRPATAAEAAARANLPELARLNAAGGDPRRVHALRPTYTDFGVSAATLPEAAVLSKNVRVVQYVEGVGLPADGDARTALACLAGDIGANEVVDYLTSRTGARHCTPGAALAALRARAPD